MIAANALEPTLVVEIAELSQEAESATTSKPRKPRVWTAFATWIVAAIAGLSAAIAGYFVVGFAIGIAMGASGTTPPRFRHVYKNGSLSRCRPCC